jgi:hypothetical protein
LTIQDLKLPFERDTIAVPCRKLTVHPTKVFAVSITEEHIEW